ncbi:hypothetical protein KOM07_05195 [Lentilactobacillus sp. G22-6]|uniref:hypothetical protein n=1 Tax=Lentilactobacillus dabitei TaxID=2831523 RepID=UPI001C27F22C|nr:hypothetical protein [Lentilactobacillus dabitei]MBU9788934.1 hypothetical protein [Lentilactobacillus dabitei]
MNEVADKPFLSKMEIIKKYFPDHSYNTVNPIFYEKDFPQFRVPGKKRPLYPAKEVDEWMHKHTEYGF